MNAMAPITPPVIGEIVVHSADWMVYRGSRFVMLTEMEFRVFHALWRRRGNPVALRALESLMYGLFRHDDNTVRVHLSRLRRNLQPINLDIHTVRGAGYALACCSRARNAA